MGIYFLKLLEVGNSKIKVQKDWAFSEGPLLGLQVATFLLCSHMAEREGSGLFLL